MSRALLGFLLFCLLLLSVTGALVWHVGPTLTGIAFDSDRRERPYYLLHLVPQRPGATPEDLVGYRAHFLELVAADGGRLAWQAGSTRRHESRARQGSLRSAMDVMDLVAFTRGGDVVQMLTGSRSRALLSSKSAGPAGAGSLLLGTSTAPQALARQDVAVVMLYQVIDGAVQHPLGVAGESGWLVALDRFGGRVAWDAPIDWIRGREPWNRLLMLQFPDAAAAAAWLRDPATTTERAIASRHLGDLLLLVAFAPG